jgi:hypothetical protein
MTTQRKLGDSGLMTPPLILGGNVFGWTADHWREFQGFGVTRPGAKS